MNKKYYEDILSKNYDYTFDSAKMWDGKAEKFNISQQGDNSVFKKGVIKFLEDKNILENSKVIDICGGSGRYALPLARLSNSVIVTDVSENMLKYAKNNAEKEELNNLEFVQGNWTEMDFDKLGWNKNFDLSFATMCPAVRTPEGLEKMMESSRKYCMINQYIENGDNIGDYLREELGKKDKYDPHADRESVEAIFNILWIDGYSPEMSYIEEKTEQELTIDEAYEKHIGRYGNMAEELGLDLKELLSRKLEDNIIKVKKNTKMAIIFWKTEKF